MTNTPRNLARRRASFNVKLNAPKAFAPVGVPEAQLMVQRALDRFGGDLNAAYKALAPLGAPGHGRHDAACESCGHRVCGCAPKVAAPPVPPAAGPAAEELAPGWRSDGSKEIVAFVHSSGVCVGQPISREFWWYAAKRGEGMDGTAPTRDEAMARALGWLPDHNDWKLVHPEHYAVSIIAKEREGRTWIVLASPRQPLPRCVWPSLSHAIAWVRGDGEPKAEKAMTYDADRLEVSVEGRRIGKTAAAFKVPAGWEPDGDQHYWRPRKGEHPTLMKSGDEPGMWCGFRHDGGMRRFTSPYVAMLFALGCDVGDQAHIPLDCLITFGLPDGSTANAAMADVDFWVAQIEELTAKVAR